MDIVRCHICSNDDTLTPSQRLEERPYRFIVSAIGKEEKSAENKDVQRETITMRKWTMREWTISLDWTMEKKHNNCANDGI
jgi:hypothetical protein